MASAHARRSASSSAAPFGQDGQTNRAYASFAPSGDAYGDGPSHASHGASHASHGASRGSRRGRGPRRHHYLRNTLVVLLVILLILGGAAGVAGWFGYRFYQEAMQVKYHEGQAVELLKTVGNTDNLKSADAIDKVLPQLREHTGAARSIAHGDLWERAAQLPTYGDDVRTVQGMTDVVDAVANDTLPRLSDVVKTLLGSSLSNGDGKVNLQPVMQAQGSFNDVNTLLKQQLERLQALPKPHVQQVSDAYDQAVTQFSAIAGTIEDANAALQALPQFLGVNGPRTYVIVAQTTSEARSGGGLVGSMGSMTTNNGTVTMNDFYPNTTFIPLYYGGSSDERSVFDGPLKFSFDVRDASANPDFDKVAQRITKIWKMASSRNSTVDGVMMIDPVFVQEMVRISGDITLRNGVRLTGDNTAEYLLNTIYKDVDPSEQDYYFQYVAQTAMNNVFRNLKVPTMMTMVKSMGELAAQRHLYMYTFHEDEAKNFQGAGLARSTSSSEENPEIGVYFNEQNPSKLGWYLRRSTVITAKGANADGSRKYHVSVTFANAIDNATLRSGNSYILGGFFNIGAPGTPVEKVLFYAPAGGSIANLKADSSAGTAPESRTLNGKDLQVSVATIAPGKSVTYTFDVTTSPKATADLTLDQTPMGWADPGVTYR